MRFEGLEPLSASQSTHFTDVKSRVLDFTFQNPKGRMDDGILYERKLANMGEIIKAEFDTFALRKTQVNWVDYKGTTNANPSTTFKQKHASD